jgi:hypothetical protein
LIDVIGGSGDRLTIGIKSQEISVTLPRPNFPLKYR